MSEDRLRAAIALHDRFTHEDWGVDRSPGAISDCRGQSDPPMDRRVFMAELTRLAGGAAAASLLLSGIAANAQAPPQVAEGDQRIETGPVAHEVRPGRRLASYMAWPRGRLDAVPVVIVIHENRGLNDHIRDVTRRLAVAGFQAVAPDFLSIAGGTPPDENRAREMIGALDMAETVVDGAALIRFMAQAGAAATPAWKVGTVGFCWGGAMVNRLAVAAGESLAAGVSFYGPAPDPAEAARVRAAMLIVLAGRDERVNATGRPWAEALRAAGKTVELREFPNVDHAFHNDTSVQRYNAEAAAQAWAATLALFARHLRT